MDTALYFFNAGFWRSPSHVALFCASVFGIVMLRYLVLSYGYHVAARRFFSNVRRLGKTSPWQWKREIAWSACSALVFTLLGAGCLWLYQQDHTRIYENITERSTGYFALSIVLMLVGYETYYYWLHRWMHKPSVFRRVHKVHHDSIHTSVFTSFSFHPLEAVLQFVFLPAFIVVVPIHYFALGIVLMIWTVSAIVNHGGVEIFPKRFHRHPIGRWLIGATHHDLHHREFRTNFGLYFTFWDKWMRTESARFDKEFETNTKEESADLNDDVVR